MSASGSDECAEPPPAEASDAELAALVQLFAARVDKLQRELADLRAQLESIGRDRAAS